MEQIEYSEEIKSQLGLTVGFEEPKEIDIEMDNAPFGGAGKTDSKEKK